VVLGVGIRVARVEQRLRRRRERRFGGSLKGGPGVFLGGGGGGCTLPLRVTPGGARVCGDAGAVARACLVTEMLRLTPAPVPCPSQAAICLATGVASSQAQL
jgi:hypothetical protein